MRFRFGPYVLSAGERTLVRDGVPVALIPRYFDLLLLLIQRRHEAVSKQAIFEAVWAGVVVGDDALTQGVRALRKVLRDDPRAPRYVATVSRHGYRFVYRDVVEEPSQAGVAARLPGLAADEAASRILPASLAGAAAGAAMGCLGGLLMWIGPGSTAQVTVLPALAFIGCVVGASGAAAVSTGIAWGSRFQALPRAIGVIAGGALAGLGLGLLFHRLVAWTALGLFGSDLSGAGGGLEGVTIGAAAAVGWLLAGGAAAPRRSRATAAVVCGLTCAAAAVVATWFGAHFVGDSLNRIAALARGAGIGLSPVVRLLGERELQPLTLALLSATEAFAFGAAWAIGFSRRERSSTP